MTGTAAPMRRNIMRRRTCASCEKRFAPKRIDAEFCSSRCRQADYRRRELRAKAESVFKSSLLIAQNAHDAAWKLEYYQDRATRQNLQSDACGYKHVRFIGIKSGILAVHSHRENDLPLPFIPWRPRPRWLFNEFKHDPANPAAGDPEVTQAVVEALNYEALGGSFIQRQYEKECQALLRDGLANGSVRRIALFTYDPDWRDKRPQDAWSRLPTAWADDWSDEHEDHTGTWFQYGDSGAAELLAGGGFQVFRADKGHP